MGLHDRDYAREQPTTAWHHVGGHQAVTLLVAIILSVFIVSLFLGLPGRGNPMLDALLFQGQAVLNGEVWRLLTANFVQPNFSLFSLILGLWFLYWAGSELETSNYGARGFLKFFLVAGLLASLAKLVVVLVLDTEPLRKAYSGGSALPGLAVLILFAIHYPHRTIMLFFILPIPVWVLAVLGLGGYALMFVGGGLGPEVAAALVVSAFALYFYRTGGVIVPFRVWGRRRPRYRIHTPPPRDRAPAETVATTSKKAENSPPQPARTADEYLEAQLDAVLDKVSKHGRGSLTPEENAILQRASEVYKRRRT